MDKVKEKIKPLICDMSGIYAQMYPDAVRVDMTDISGTNCYCDDEAAAHIRERLLSQSDLFSRVRLLDSGNYHYLSYFFMERVEEPFSLILIDNHTDLQQPGFGRILSCGGWVRYAMEELPQLKSVYLLGMSLKHLSEAHPLPHGATYIDHRDPSGFNPLEKAFPVYISIDKDALSPEYAATDWDQGDMTLDELFFIIDTIASDHPIIGIDICGEKKESPAAAELFLNRDTNDKLLKRIP